MGNRVERGSLLPTLPLYTAVVQGLMGGVMRFVRCCRNVRSIMQFFQGMSSCFPSPNGCVSSQVSLSNARIGAPCTSLPPFGHMLTVLKEWGF